MSKYDWEEGSLKIPAAEWPHLKQKLAITWNDGIGRRYELALQLFQHLKTLSKGKRKFDFAKEAQAWAEKQRQMHRPGSMGFFANMRSNPDRAAEEIISVVLPLRDGVRRPVAPRKRDFPFAKPRQLRYGAHQVCYWEGSLTFENETRTLHWRVVENNNAVARAWEHPMGHALLKLLRSIKWTRGSGGTIIGNDEYNRDSRYEGGGGNYVTRRFGPLAEDR